MHENVTVMRRIHGFVRTGTCIPAARIIAEQYTVIIAL